MEVRFLGWGWGSLGQAVFGSAGLGGISCSEGVSCLGPRSKLPSWARAVTPRIFYITEKAWNYYPYTITGEPRAGRGTGTPGTLSLPRGGEAAGTCPRSHCSLSPP